MSFQTLITASLALASLLYFFRNTLKSAASGGCASGCEGCGSKCPVSKLQAVQRELEAKR